MAATDQNYRSTKTLNLVFAVSSVLMFLSIIWMLVDDYQREFKVVQREFRDVETQLTLTQMLANMPDTKALDKAQETVLSLRKDRDDKRARLRAENSQLIAARDRAESTYQKWKADNDAVSSYREAAADSVAAAKSPEERKVAQDLLDSREKQLAEIKTKTDEAESAFQKAHLAVEEAITSQLVEEERKLADAEDDLKRISGAFDRFAKLAAEKRWKFGDTFRNLPILDAFNSPTRIDQIVLRDLPIDYGGFMEVTRYDRCTSCHLAIDRGTFDRKSLRALANPNEKLQDRLDEARAVLKDRVKNGAKLGFDPDDLPKKITAIDLTEAQVVQFAAHPRLDLFADGNSPHPKEKFGCTICHAGQGSATDFKNAIHSPNDPEQKKRWEKNGWHPIHDWDFPMHTKRFVESSCVKCHHEMTDLVRYGSKEEAPKLLEGYNLVRENGCYGCHEIAGMKRGRAIGPDMRLEPTPPLEWLPPREQQTLKADTLNPPGTLRKVGPSLRRLSDKIGPKVNDWLLSWIDNPRHFRADTKMPRFYGLSTNNKDALPDDQKAFPDAEIHALAHYLITESNLHLKGEDSTRAVTRKEMERLYQKLKRLHGSAAGGRAPSKDEIGRLKRELPRDKKNLDKLTVRYRDLSLMSRPTNAREINDLVEELQGLNAVVTDERLSEAEVSKTFDRIEGKTGIMSRLQTLSVPLPSVRTAKELIGEDGRPFPVSEVPEKTDVEEGKRWFTVKGCLACHSHSGNPVPRIEEGSVSKPKVVSDANFGPNLSRIANKIPDGKDGRLWLIQWVLNPNVHHPRTRMPVTHLDVKEAAAIADWLLSQKDTAWKPSPVQRPRTESLQTMARVSLLKSPAIGRQNADQVLSGGLTEKQANDLDADADEQALVKRDARGKPIKGKIDDERLMLYIGKKAISRLGCFGCHDIPGFEGAKPIGTPLNDWGKKDPERLAFEDARSFVEDHFNIVDLRDSAKDANKPSADWKSEGGKTPYEEFYFEAVSHHQREGFLHLKLQNPRSYDFNRIRNWEDRLRMPQFRFSKTAQRTDSTGEPEPVAAYEQRRQRQEQADYRFSVFGREQLFAEAQAREAVMTFILGLVADPVPLKFVSQPKAERLAEARGRQVLDKYNCAGCHEIRPGTYEFNLPTNPKTRGRLMDDLTDPKKRTRPEDFFFPESNAWVGRASPVPGHLFAHGVSVDDNSPLRKTDKEDEIFPNQMVYAVRLMQALRFKDSNGVERDLLAGEKLNLAAADVVARSDTYGGHLPRLLGGYLKKLDANTYGDVNSQNQRAALPPQLIREGERVQPGWLYKFLRDPFKVRPFTVLRMPRFNMSPEEARALVDYFGAVDKLENPGMGLTESYSTVPQQESKFWKERNAAYVGRLRKGTDGPKHLQERKEQLRQVWQLDVVDRVTRKKRELDEAEASVKSIKDETAKKTEEARRDEIKKELKDLEAETARLKKDDFSSKEFKAFEGEWEGEQVYAADAYRLLTDAKTACVSCHSVGDLKVPGEKGPNLGLAHERLRPRWTKQWIANPARLRTFNPFMPQGFPNDKPPAHEPFEGTPLQQVIGVRDVLMNLPRTANLPVNRYRSAPKGGK